MNPLAKYMRERSGDIVMASTIINMLVADNDPRLSKFSTGNVGASIDGFYNIGASLPGTYATAPTAATYHMNLAELYFILAESYLVTSEPDLAYSAFVEGVSASLTDVGVSGWPLNLPSDASSLTLEDIINQKYIANYPAVQAFNDWRRTGFPVLKLPPDFVLSEIPRRYLYPTDEVDLNKNISNDEITYFSRVWWDAL